MSFLMKLNLPKNPLVDPLAVSSTFITGGYNIVKPHKVLTDEVMDIFSDLKLKPKFVSLFGGLMRRSSSADTRMIHTDLYQLPDLTWKKILFGINWEIGDAENIFRWYDMTGIKEIWPLVVVPEKYQTLSGIHYIDKFKSGIPEGAILLDEVVMTYDGGPTLVRTNAPHMTIYKSTLLPRVGVSVRFDESDFDTWEDVTAFMQQIKN